MDIKHCIEQVVVFNDIAGNLDNITQKSLIVQARVVAEEGNELLEAVLEGNPNEILKECTDVLVTIHGFVKMLEEQGYDVLGAWNAVNINNLSKFPVDSINIVKTLDMYDEKGIDVSCEYSDCYKVYVVKNEAGKVVKPYGYKKCSVAAYTPKGILPKVKLPEQGEIN